MEIKGLDISSYKKGMKLKKDIGFCILRAGFTGWGGDGTNKYLDETFEDFYNQCKSLGIPVGAYWFSCANSYEKGRAEAEFMYNSCLKNKKFEYPIYIDVEDSHHQSGNKRGVTDAIKGFCEYLEEKRFYVGVYGSDIATFQEKVYLDELKDYDKWVARYGSSPKYVKNYQMWQYAENGTYNGYSQVDMNNCYIDYPKIIVEKGFNGYTSTQQSDTAPSQVPSPSNPLDKYTDEQLADMVLQGKFGNGEDRKKALSNRYSEVQNIVNQKVYKPKNIEIGTKVKTIKEGNGSSDGSSNRARTGLIGKVKRIKEGAKYPYLVEDYGWYKKDALEII